MAGVVGSQLETGMGLKIQTDQERIPPSSEPGRHLALCKEPDEGAPPDTSDVEDLVRYD